MFELIKSEQLIGEILLGKNSISKLDLEKALAIQVIEGGYLGKILTSTNLVNEKNFYQGLAEQYALLFYDLDSITVDSKLLKINDLDLYLEHNFIPIAEKDNCVTIATSEPCMVLITLLHKKFTNFTLVIVTHTQIIQTCEKYFAEYLDFKARNSLWQATPAKSALFILNDSQRINVILCLLACFMIICAKPLVFLVFVNVFYLINNIFKFVISIIGSQAKQAQTNFDHLSECDLPIYSIIVPVFREASLIRNIIENLNNLDYPKSKLDIKIAVEADDTETINILRKIQLDSIFQIIIIPFSLPRTKPKACNYALFFTKGKYVTIYDADDVPEPSQLKQAVAKFQSLEGSNVICLQAKLNYFNRNENILTKFFSLEYAIWFDFLVPGLEKASMPIPLGGTSNHFIRDKLLEVGGWDPYNVTEDADLGIRMASLGYKVSTINSLTLEEAPIKVNAWLKQRTRWIKGYLHSFLVHSRSMAELGKSIGIKGMIGFLLFIGAPFVSFFITPFMYIGWFFLNFKDVEQIPKLLITLWKFNLLFGVISIILSGCMIIIRKKWYHLIFINFFLPFYWLLHSIASFRALIQIIRKPHFWDKTKHGVSEYYAKNRFL